MFEPKQTVRNLEALAISVARDEHGGIRAGFESWRVPRRLVSAKLVLCSTPVIKNHAAADATQASAYDSAVSGYEKRQRSMLAS